MTNTKVPLAEAGVVSEVVDITGESPAPCGDGGSLPVRHATAVVTDDGQEHVTRPVAVCTGERSARLPWCDSTHKSVRRSR